MSLLMDALKKAEEEKRQAAKRLQEVEAGSREVTNGHKIEDNGSTAKEEDAAAEILLDTVEFSLKPLQLEARPEEPNEEKSNEKVTDANPETVDENEIQAADVTEAFSADLTMENTTADEITLQESFEETEKEIDINDATIVEELSSENVSAPPFDDTFHDVPFDEEEQGGEVYEETLPGVPAEQLAEDLGGGEFQPTPVAARTVFSAGKKRNSFKWGMFAVLVFLAIGSFAVLYYFTITPVARSLPSPLIAASVGSALERPPVTGSPPEPEVVTGSTVSPATEEAQDVDIVEKTEQPDVETADTQVVNNVTDNAINVAEHVEKVAVAAGLAEQKEVSGSVVESSVEMEPVDETDNERLPADQLNVDEESISENTIEQPLENFQVDASSIIISKSKAPDIKNVMVSQAYNAYQDGQYHAAYSMYKEVLKNEPDNRDAHLGLAAIALNNQDRESAYFHYAHLLDLNPLDTLALNALIALTDSADPVKDESAIKSLIQREGDAPYLYFSLGNLYAKQKRWADAQQAFFDAYRLDTTNPDYVINLAISLDQMGQYSTALDYYETAMALSKNTSIRFDTVTVNNRILALSEITEPEL